MRNSNVTRDVRLALRALVAVFALLGDLAIGSASTRAPSPSQAPSQAAQRPSPAGASESATETESLPNIVARVNGSEITKEHLLERAELIRTQLPAGSAGADFYARVLENMVGAELLSQSATKNGFMPSDEELEAELSNQSVRFGGLEAFRSALEQQGLSLEDARSDLRRDMGIQRLIDEKIGAAVLVTEEEKQSFYDENQEAMQSPERFKVAHILIGVEDSATTEEKAAARKKAESIRSMVDAGQDFADLARRNSDDPGSKDTGGELPMMRRGETVAPFEAAALTLAPGELSDVVETQYGYHVIKMVERHEAGTSSYEEVQERIGQFLHQRQLQQRIEEEVQRLRQEGEVEVFL